MSVATYIASQQKLHSEQAGRTGHGSEQRQTGKTG